MNRSEFLKNSMLATGSLVAASTINAFAADDSANMGNVKKGKTFNLDYAPHEGMFSNLAGKSFLDQIQYMYDQGFQIN